MRYISAETILEKAKQMIQEANFYLPKEVEKKLNEFKTQETAKTAKFGLTIIAKNAKIASQKKLPLCQDTGTAVFFVEIGHQVQLDEPLFNTLERATEEAYKENYLRASIVKDPLFERVNTKNNCPPVLHIEQVFGDTMSISFLPKGGGAENKSVIKMLRPIDGKEGVIQTIIDAAKKAGGTSCPPWILGIGIGGTFDTVAALAKKAILRPLGTKHKDQKYASLEKEILKKGEELKIGTMGFGGSKTILGVHIEVAPAHIASLPIAVNFQCHSARSMREII